MLWTCVCVLAAGVPAALFVAWHMWITEMRGRAVQDWLSDAVGSEDSVATERAYPSSLPGK